MCDLSKGLKNAELLARNHAGNDIFILAENLKELAKLSFSITPKEAITLMEESNILVPSVSKRKWLAFKYYKIDDIPNSYKYIITIQDKYIKNGSEQKIKNQIKSKYEDLSNFNDEIKQILSKVSLLVSDVESLKLCLNQNKTKDRTDGSIQATKNVQEDNPEYEYDINAVMSEKQINWFNLHKDKVDSIKESNGGKFYEKNSTKIGIICDKFYYESIESAANFVYLTPDNYQSIVSSNNIDVLLFVSTWRGLNEEWKGIASNPTRESANRKIALSCIKECKNRKIPTVFLSKEDPPNYLVFIDYAKECDYIYTTARECVEYYKKDCNNDNVSAILFGINPHYHNPIMFKNQKEKNSVLFSGSWMKKYKDRCHDFEMMADGVMFSDRDFNIIDRNFPLNKNYIFPKKFFSYCVPAIDHEILQKVHKLSDWSININSVTKSSTMFANRAYELLASGCSLLSNYSVGMNYLLPNINIVYDKREVKNILSLRSDYLYEKQIFNIRSVMTGHTCFDRVNTILNRIGLSNNETIPLRKVLVIVDSNNKSVLDSFNMQTYVNKELILSNQVNDVVLSKFDIVTWFSDKYLYEEYYLEDMCNGFKYTDSDFITKLSIEDKIDINKEHVFVTEYNSIYTTIFWIKSYDSKDIIQHKLKSSNGYSIDCFNIKINNNRQVDQSYKYKISVIIPIYNNGKSLYGKCFDSLRRSSIFEEMELIFVDDGSSDSITLALENYLERNYQNVKLYRFPKGGSGSASRPRNKGVELATSDYITFLDPDNEAINDGYAKLYNIAIEKDFDVLVGNMIEFNDTLKKHDYYNKVLKTLKATEFSNGIKLYISELNYSGASIQAMLIKSEFIKNCEFKEVCGAAGQDTLYSWQIMCSDIRLAFINEDIHIYYSLTDGSVTNNLSTKFFSKLLLLQQPKLDWLEKEGFIEDFMNKRYSKYIGWVFKHLSMCQENVKDECTKVVFDILSVYQDVYTSDNSLINTFMHLCLTKRFDLAFSKVKEKFISEQIVPYISLEKLYPEKTKELYFQGNYKVEGNQVFINISNNENENKMSIVVLKNYEGYVVKEQYLNIDSGKTQILDFSNYDKGVYRIRVFKKINNIKKSEDVLFIIREQNILVDNKKVIALVRDENLV